MSSRKKIIIHHKFRLSASRGLDWLNWIDLIKLVYIVLVQSWLSSLWFSCCGHFNNNINDIYSTLVQLIYIRTLSHVSLTLSVACDDCSGCSNPLSTTQCGPLHAMDVVMESSQSLTHQIQTLLNNLKASYILSLAPMGDFGYVMLHSWKLLQSSCITALRFSLCTTCTLLHSFPLLPVFRVHTQGGEGNHPDTRVTSLHGHTNHCKHPWVEGCQVGGTCGTKWPHFSCNREEWLFSSPPLYILLPHAWIPELSFLPSPSSSLFLCHLYIQSLPIPPSPRPSLSTITLSLPTPPSLHPSLLCRHPLQWTCRISWCPCASICLSAGAFSKQGPYTLLIHTTLGLGYRIARGGGGGGGWNLMQSANLSLWIALQLNESPTKYQFEGVKPADTLTT